MPSVYIGTKSNVCVIKNVYYNKESSSLKYFLPFREDFFTIKMIFSFNKVFKLFSEIVKILSMNRMLYRGVLSLIGLIIYFGVANNSPVPAVIMIVVLSISVAFWVRINPEKNDNPLQVPSYYDTEFEQRSAALDQAKIFLAPYKNIWRDLRLSNKYCTLTLGHDGVTIKCIEKVKPYRRLQVVETYVHSAHELWNLFCIYFTYNKSYDGVLEDCNRYKALVIQTYGSESENNKNTDKNVPVISDTRPAQNQNINIEKLDINNCSEIELTELPGISIVLAKKTIKRREEIGGFKSVDDFLNFIKLKPHMENQLRSRVKVEKMKGSIYQKRHSERSVDF